MKGFWKEFKAFISRGNIVDLSVAVIIGGAFSAIVTALTNKIIMPLVNMILSVGGAGLSSAYTFLKTAYLEDGVTIDLANSIYIDWGAFITAIINFFIIALTIFILIKVINASTKKFKQLESAVIGQSKKEYRQERKEVKALAVEQGRPFKEVWAEHEAEKQKAIEAEEEQKKAEEAEKQAKERLENPTQEDLLKEIRDLLKSNAVNAQVASEVLNDKTSDEVKE